MQPITTEISTATMRNWNRLGTDIFGTKLTKRANKRLSEKRFIPEEYIANRDIIEKSYIAYDDGYSIEEILYSLTLNLTQQVKNKYLPEELDFRNIPTSHINQDLATCKIMTQSDILGGVYQSLLTEGEKNKKGSYYTPNSLVQSQIKDYFQEGQTFLDPCCGTGQYLLNIPTKYPENLWGTDIDQLAVKIARINLMIKYPNQHFLPHVSCMDSLLQSHTLFSISHFPEEYFDMIATNPPWGAKLSTYDGYKIKSGESFSYFIERGLKLLKKGGILSYILPESLLNVKVHEDIREILLHYNILSIHELGRAFTGVFTPVIRLDVKKEKEDGVINIYSDTKHSLPKTSFLQNPNYIFSIHSQTSDNQLFEKLYSRKCLFLDNENADRALGIVTGDNQKFLSDEAKDNHVPVYTGKEVDFYTLKSPKKYLLYEPEHYQQIAPLVKYQTKPKLIYKFISNKLVFSLDTNGVFTLNSANILIPKIDYPIKVILALFNSDLYQQIFQKRFNSIKVLKSHLQSLPLPILDSFTYKKIEESVDDVVAGKTSKEELDRYLFTLLIN